MFGFKLSEVKKLFFDRERVKRAMDAGTRRALSRFGFEVRRSAKLSIRTAKGPSRPGTPPHSHKHLLRKFIYFAFSPVARSVVIGPTLIGKGSPYGETTVPEVLEYGGIVETTVRDRAQVRDYPERPYMRPAFDRWTKRLPEVWANSVR